MKRFFLSTFCFLAACGGTGDDLALDGSIDQTSGGDAVVDAPADVTTSDVAGDAPDDVVSIDGASDASVDAPDDVVSVVDASTGNCTSNATCLVTQYCEKGGGKCGGKGVCTPRPQICSQIVLPVCGCNKMTYINECYAHQAGETVAYTGACE
ncbi:MAG TPA: Kazal-type serine protease inhibitor [Polyangiaceae bacterium]|jgi:hypothetical protein